MEDGILHLDESGARQLVLVRAIEDVDTQGRLLSAVERDQLEREALAASPQTPAGAIDFGHYLRERALRVLAAVGNRNPRLAALHEGEPWRAWLMAGLPVAACVLGAAIDRIDNPQQVNMLSPPLLGVLAWNLLMYLFLAVSLVLPRTWLQRTPLAPLQRWMAGAGARRTGRLRSDVLARFHEHWARAAGPQQLWWWKQLLHLAAAGWALGLAFSIVLGGVVREYRVGWESTLLDVHQVHAFLSALFAPVVALLPFEAFTVADLQRMAFRSGAAVGVDEARRWIWMYVALLGLLVVAPRLLLAAWAAWRRGRLGRSVAFDLRDPYFVQVLGRVSPARVTLGIVGAGGPAREALMRVLRQVTDHAPPRDGGPWTVLSTARGDVLRVFDVPAGFSPPAPRVTAGAGSGSAAQAWLQDLLGRFRAPARGQERDAVQATLADTDLMLVVPARPGELQDMTRLLHWVAQPALVLASDAEEDYRAAVQRLGLAAEVLPLADCMAHWMRDARLLQAAQARIASGKRAGFERIAVAWEERNTARFAEAMRLLAGELVRAARDSEEAGSGAASLRHLVSAAERDAAQRAREHARTALLQRLRAGESAVLADLVQLHRTGTTLAPVSAAGTELGFTEQQVIARPQAGVAGAATGAAMGAGVDLLTGGLTLGAAAALGAVIGGGAGYLAAAWRNRASASGQPQVQLGDDLLQTFTEGLLLAYLAVAHRGGRDTQEGAPAAWRSEVVAAVEARKGELAARWQQARSAPEASAAVGPLAFELEGIARGLLTRI